jgi:hypothetical protein
MTSSSVAAPIGMSDPKYGFCDRVDLWQLHLNRVQAAASRGSHEWVCSVVVCAYDGRHACEESCAGQPNWNLNLRSPNSF